LTEFRVSSPLGSSSRCPVVPQSVVPWSVVRCLVVRGLLALLTLQPFNPLTFFNPVSLSRGPWSCIPFASIRVNSCNSCLFASIGVHWRFASLRPLRSFVANIRLIRVHLRLKNPCHPHHPWSTPFSCKFVCSVVNPFLRPLRPFVANKAVRVNSCN
jgi:hypothetical protein